MYKYRCFHSCLVTLSFSVSNIRKMSHLWTCEVYVLASWAYNTGSSKSSHVDVRSKPAGGHVKAKAERYIQLRRKAQGSPNFTIWYNRRWLILFGVFDLLCVSSLCFDVIALANWQLNRGYHSLNGYTHHDYRRNVWTHTLTLFFILTSPSFF